MFEDFTERSRRMVVLAQEEARLLGHTVVGSEHLMLALISDDAGIAGHVLKTFGVEIRPARSIASELFGAEEPSSGSLDLTTWLKSAIDNSRTEADALGHDYVGTEHLLLGLIKMGKGGWRTILKRFDINERDVRASVLGMVDAYEYGSVLRAKEDMAPRESVHYAKSGSPYEARYGFSRGFRIGNRVEIAGTAPVPPLGEEVAETAYDQMRRCCDIAVEALEELGASVNDVVRTVMYITDAAESDEVGRVHGEVFGEAAPAATMVVVAGLLDPAWKVEIEVYAQL